MSLVECLLLLWYLIEFFIEYVRINFHIYNVQLAVCLWHRVYGSARNRLKTEVRYIHGKNQTGCVWIYFFVMFVCTLIYSTHKWRWSLILNLSGEHILYFYSENFQEEFLYCTENFMEQTFLRNIQKKCTCHMDGWFLNYLKILTLINDK